MDLPNIGARCDLPDCRMYDFLPFKCHKCEGQFCLEHRSFEDHHCVAFLSEAEKRNVNTIPAAVVAPAPPCAMNGCTHLREHCARISCNSCRKTFCVHHRLPEDHNCERLVAQKKPASNASIVGASVKRSLQSNVLESAAGGIVSPKGLHQDDSISFTLFLLPPLGPDYALRCTVRLNRRWSVGKAVDWLCSHFGIAGAPQKRHRLVAFGRLLILPNHLALKEAGVDDSIGIALIPENWISSAASGTTEPIQKEVDLKSDVSGSDGCRWQERMLELRATWVAECPAVQ
eukprot:NODE_2877_length_1098_cov_86.606292_g2639_i0.p1 GENE.NODE_2877_length_1098_cov_86.606292_g2639_i0~~NODE_2877_length_1098_cov_86.606292_g2639_i0.p1  ORF type:complete len:288 (+),score=47.95 NODE_2877_length_1098_cov_86.606292_g2639_i0:81-944(+)